MSTKEIRLLFELFHGKIEIFGIRSRKSAQSPVAEMVHMGENPKPDEIAWKFQLRGYCEGLAVQTVGAM